MKLRGYILIVGLLILVAAIVTMLFINQRDDELTTGQETVSPSATSVATSTPTCTPTSSPTEAPTVIPTTTPTAKPTAKPTATPTVTPTVMPTVRPTAAPTTRPTATPSPQATPTAKPTESPVANVDSIYSYVKTCGLYGTPRTSSLGYMDCYFLKSAVPSITDAGIYKDSTWYVYIDQYEEMEPGYDCSILMTSYGKETRDQVLELLKVIYPTGYQEVMDLIVKSIRQEIWEYGWENSDGIPLAGTMGVRYIDGREVYLIMRSDYVSLTIHIRDVGVVNPNVYVPWPEETIEYWTNQGVGQSQSDFAKWFREEHDL